MWGLKTALCGAEVYLIESNPWVVEWGRGSQEGEGVILSDHAIQGTSQGGDAGLKYVDVFPCLVKYYHLTFRKYLAKFRKYFRSVTTLQIISWFPNPPPLKVAAITVISTPDYGVITC